MYSLPVLAPGSWAPLSTAEESCPARQIGITMHPGSPTTGEAPFSWQSHYASLSHLFSCLLKKLPKHFLSASTSNISDLSLIDFASYFIKNRNTRQDLAQLCATLSIYLTCIRAGFPLLWIQRSDRSPLNKIYFPSCSGPEDTEKRFMVAAPNKSHTEVRWEGTRRWRKQQDSLDNSFEKCDHEGRQFLLSPKP